MPWQRGARKALGCDIALSSTGVAGPDKDDRGNEVGTVYIALAHSGGTTDRLFHFHGDRAAIRSDAADAAFRLLMQHINENQPTD